MDPLDHPEDLLPHLSERVCKVGPIQRILLANRSFLLYLWYPSTILIYLRMPLCRRGAVDFKLQRPLVLVFLPLSERLMLK